LFVFQALFEAPMGNLMGDLPLMTQMAWGAHAPSRVAVGALADCFRSFKEIWRRARDVVGGGAAHDTRGRMCYPESSCVAGYSNGLELMRRFRAQKRSFKESTQFPMPQHLSDKKPDNRLVLTEKRGLFWGVLAAKSMFREIKMSFSFEFLRFFKNFCVARRCR